MKSVRLLLFRLKQIIMKAVVARPTPTAAIATSQGAARHTQEVPGLPNAYLRHWDCGVRVMSNQASYRGCEGQRGKTMVGT